MREVRQPRTDTPDLTGDQAFGFIPERKVQQAENHLPYIDAKKNSRQKIEPLRFSSTGSSYYTFVIYTKTYYRAIRAL